MSSVVISGDTSGAITLAAPTIAGTSTLTLPSGASGTIAAQGVSTNIVSGTAVSASGTSVDFTGIPSWVRRITVLLNGVSLSGTGLPVIQIGAGSVETTGYICYASYSGSSSGATNATTYFLTRAGGAVSADVIYGVATIALLGSNAWVYSFSGGMNSGGSYGSLGGGSKTTSGTLDRVRITSTTGTDTFDAGSINILYE